MSCARVIARLVRAIHPSAGALSESPTWPSVDSPNKPGDDGVVVAEFRGRAPGFRRSRQAAPFPLTPTLSREGRGRQTATGRGDIRLSFRTPSGMHPVAILRRRNSLSPCGRGAGGEGAGRAPAFAVRAKLARTPHPQPSLAGEREASGAPPYAARRSCFPSRTSSMILRLKSSRSPGLREVMTPASVTTEASSQRAPAFSTSVRMDL